MDGLTLKNWRLGEKIGAGACSDVYAVEPLKSVSTNHGAQFVMKVSRIPDVPASKAKNKKRKKTPAERNADALYAEYLVYQSCLRDHARVPRLPDGAYGEDKGYRFLVLERLGRTLEQVLHDEGPIPSATAARLGLELLDTLEHLHVHNLVYVDVKPENFLVDATTESKVYCVDFGISDRYVMATGKHKELKTGAVVGTPTFLSASCHAGATPSRRDDIEALLYVLLYLQLGSLPWQQATSDAAGAAIKKSTTPQTLCCDLPREWPQMLAHSRACAFDDKPDYAFYATKLRALGGELGATTPFDWGSSSKSKATTKAKGKVTAMAKAKGKAAMTTTTNTSSVHADDDDAAATPSASPTRKRVKSEREARETEQQQHAATKTRATVPTAKTKRVAAASAKPKAKAKPRGSSRSRVAKTRAAATSSDDDEASDTENQNDSELDSDDNEPPHVGKRVVKGPGRKEMAKRLAIAAHAAATGALKIAERTSTRVLRSSKSSQ